MTLVEPLKFVIGLLFAVGGVVLLALTRRERGFGQRRQAGAMFLVVAVVFAGVGLGLIDI